MNSEKRKRTDERDIVLARMHYEKGTPIYESYYSRNPHKEKTDAALRAMPELSSEGTATYDPVTSPIIDATFRFLSDIKENVEGPVQPGKELSIDPGEMTERIKGLARYYSAKLIGITKMQRYHYYSHRGRPGKNYGKKIDKYHKYGIVFAVEMDKEMVFRAPQLSQAIAATKGYVDGAIIGMILSYYIRELGFEARNHMDGNYLIVAPLVALDAGLGEIGRNGLLITKEYGPRVRLGVVTTDMPLIPDEPADFGIARFCEVCKRCVRTCPGKAIPKGPKTEVDGIPRWRINPDQCYERWRSLGTDCGICLASCPFSDGIPTEYVDRLKTDKKIFGKILKDHDKKYPIRPYIKDKPSWL